MLFLFLTFTCYVIPCKKFTCLGCSVIFHITWTSVVKVRMYDQDSNRQIGRLIGEFRSQWRKHFSPFVMYRVLYGYSAMYLRSRHESFTNKTLSLLFGRLILWAWRGYNRCFVLVTHTTDILLKFFQLLKYLHRSRQKPIVPTTFGFDFPKSFLVLLLWIDMRTKDVPITVMWS